MIKYTELEIGMIPSLKLHLNNCVICITSGDSAFIYIDAYFFSNNHFRKGYSEMNIQFKILKENNYQLLNTINIQIIFFSIFKCINFTLFPGDSKITKAMD